MVTPLINSVQGKGNGIMEIGTVHTTEKSLYILPLKLIETTATNQEVLRYIHILQMYVIQSDCCFFIVLVSMQLKRVGLFFPQKNIYFSK